MILFAHSMSERKILGLPHCIKRRGGCSQRHHLQGVSGKIAGSHDPI
jgi:hypothetical protein